MEQIDHRAEIKAVGFKLCGLHQLHVVETKQPHETIYATDDIWWNGLYWTVIGTLSESSYNIYPSDVADPYLEAIADFIDEQSWLVAIRCRQNNGFFSTKNRTPAVVVANVIKSGERIVIGHRDGTYCLTLPSFEVSILSMLNDTWTGNPTFLKFFEMADPQCLQNILTWITTAFSTDASLKYDRHRFSHKR